MNSYKKDDIVVKYKNHLISPKVVFIFSILIFQEVVKKALTQSRNNIFYILNKKYRDNGLTEEHIMRRIRKDAKAYKLIYCYFDKPTNTTIKSKEKKLNSWLTKLNKLRFGVFDDYLFNLSDATQLSLIETTETSIKIKLN